MRIEDRTIYGHRFAFKHDSTNLFLSDAFDRLTAFLDRRPALPAITRANRID